MAGSWYNNRPGESVRATKVIIINPLFGLLGHPAFLDVSRSHLGALAVKSSALSSQRFFLSLLKWFLMVVETRKHQQAESCAGRVEPLTLSSSIKQPKSGEVMRAVTLLHSHAAFKSFRPGRRLSV